MANENAKKVLALDESRYLRLSEIADYKIESKMSNLNHFIWFTLENINFFIIFWENYFFYSKPTYKKNLKTTFGYTIWVLELKF